MEEITGKSFNLVTSLNWDNDVNTDLDVPTSLNVDGVIYTVDVAVEFVRHHTHRESIAANRTESGPNRARLRYGGRTSSYTAARFSFSLKVGQVQSEETTLEHEVFHVLNLGPLFGHLMNKK